MVDSDNLRDSLGWYRRRFQYLHAVIAKRPRIDLYGNAVGEVTDKESVTVDQLPITERTGNYKYIIRSFQNPTTVNLMGQLLMGTTVLGYLAMCANKMLQGQGDMPDSANGKVWKAAMLKGGGLGLTGGLPVPGIYSRYGRSFITEATGPMMGVASDVFALYADAKNGDWDKTRTQSLKLLKRNMVGQNLFYLEPALARVWEGLGIEK